MNYQYGILSHDTLQDDQEDEKMLCLFFQAKDLIIGYSLNTEIEWLKFPSMQKKEDVSR